jgi:hypothetical protein
VLLAGGHRAHLLGGRSGDPRLHAEVAELQHAVDGPGEPVGRVGGPGGELQAARTLPSVSTSTVPVTCQRRSVSSKA